MSNFVPLLKEEAQPFMKFTHIYKSITEANKVIEIENNNEQVSRLAFKTNNTTRKKQILQWLKQLLNTLNVWLMDVLNVRLMARRKR
jgi:hypothetical protein